MRGEKVWGGVVKPRSPPGLSGEGEGGGEIGEGRGV